MTEKLKLKLTAAELSALRAHLYLTVSSQPMDELRANPSDFLICSTLMELFGRVNAKVEDVRLFPTRRTDALYPVSLTRSQALAFVCTVLTDDQKTDDNTSATMEVLPFQDDTYEAAFLQRLVGTIHQAYFV